MWTIVKTHPMCYKTVLKAEWRCGWGVLELDWGWRWKGWVSESNRYALGGFVSAFVALISMRRYHVSFIGVTKK